MAGGMSRNEGRSPGRLLTQQPLNVPPEVTQQAQDISKSGDTTHLDDLLTSLVLSQLQASKPLGTGQQVLQNLYQSPLGGNPAGGPLLAMIMGLTDTPMPSGAGRGRGITGTGTGSDNTMSAIIDSLAKIQGMKLAGNKDVRAQAKAQRDEQQANLLSPEEQQQAARTKGGLDMSVFEKASLGLKQEVEGIKLRMQKEGLNNQQINTYLKMLDTRMNELRLQIESGKYSQEEQMFPYKLADLQQKDPTFTKMLELIRTAPADQRQDLQAKAMKYFAEKTGVPFEMSQSIGQKLMNAVGLGDTQPASMLPPGQQPLGTPVPSPTPAPTQGASPAPTDPIGAMLQQMKANGVLK